MVRLHLDELENCLTPAEVNEKLNSLPSALHDRYKNTLDHLIASGLLKYSPGLPFPPFHSQWMMSITLWLSQCALQRSMRRS